MLNPKDILVLTTSANDELKILKYFKPVSAHLVAGTNLFSDFLGGITDVFGGRSLNYQKQLSILYNDAVEQLKFAAFELGANCIIGLNIDIDEISGKGKSMFMVTAVGTAVQIDDKYLMDENQSLKKDKLTSISFLQLDSLRIKKELINTANENNLQLNDETWSYIISNRIEELYPYLLSKYSMTLPYEQNSPENSRAFKEKLLEFIKVFPNDTKRKLLYNTIQNEDNDKLAQKISDIINELNLLDLDEVQKILQHNDFKIQKRGLKIATYNKDYFDINDIPKFNNILGVIEKIFQEKGSRTVKKQLLSSKEKEVWNCTCGKSGNDIDAFCSSCGNDIYGFKYDEATPQKVSQLLNEKIKLISEYLE